MAKQSRNTLYGKLYYICVNMNRCMEVGVCKCSVCELVTGNYNYGAGCVGPRIPQTVQL